MKRKLTLFLSAVMATSCLPMTAYAANFKDIKDVPWAGAADVINSVADLGLLSGYEDGTFRARNNVTYCEAMQMVYNALIKTGATSGIDAVDAYSYMAVLNTYKVPSWCQMAVAYGLHNGIIDMQMVATKFSGGTQAATREDVALMFGNALGMFYDKDKTAATVSEFVDHWSITSDTAVQIDLLKRLGVVSGDEYNRFNPKKNINRAEMAVMLNKTNGILTEGVSASGEITELQVNEGKYYYIKVALDAGGWEGFNATLGDFPVNVGNTSETISQSKLNEGDEVVLVRSGNAVTALRQMKGTTNQGKYDITGYVNSIKDNKLSLENENTGETDKYKLDSCTKCYVEGEKVSRADLEDIMSEHYKDYAYAGLITSVEREKNDDGEYENVTYIEELYITFTDEYSMTGQVKGFNNSSITVKLADSSAEKSILFATDCKFYIAGEEVDFDEMDELADAGTTYAKVTVNSSDKATKIEMSEDTFATGTEEKESLTYKVKSISDKKMVLEVSGNTTTYVFGSTNPLYNIRFYTWEEEDEDWDILKNVDKAETYVDNSEDTIYCKVTFNSGGKLSEIYLADTKSAWKNSEDHQTERKGTVVSLVNDVLKFKTSSIEYKMLKSYEDGDLNIGSAVTESKTVLARMANDSDLELYAEIKANGDNEVIEVVEARLTAAKGDLVEFNPSDKFIKIKTEDGNEFKLVCQRSPKLTDEEEDVFELEDLEGTNSKYVGETIELGFNSSGVVTQITVVDGQKSTDATTKVKGIATAANDGLKVKGDSTTYRWLSKTSDITIRNYSGSSESLSVIKKMIEDDALEVYVVATLDDKDRVEAISVYVQSAEGVLKSCDDDVVRITTEDGNTFSFDLPSKLDSCDVDGLDQDKLEDGKADGKGYEVKLTFADDGRVSEIEEA